MLNVFRFLLPTFALLFMLPVQGHAYEGQNICRDAQDLQNTPNPPLSIVILMHTKCLEQNLSPQIQLIVYNNRGIARNDKGDLDGAIADFNKAISINPNISEVYNNRGNARNDKGDLDGAIADFNTAISIDPTLASAYAGRSFAYKAQGDQVKANADLKKAQELDPKTY